MPYEIETKNNHKFLNASQIAILLSLGLHLLIYKYGFPTLLIKEESSNREKMVSTIELNPLEQARLPKLEPEWNIPTFDNTPLDEAAPPFALPLPPNFDPSASLPPIPVPPVSSNIELPPLGITDLADLPLPPPLEDLDSLTPPDAPVTTPEETIENPPPPEEEPSIPPPTETLPEEPEPSDKPTPEQIAAVRQQKLRGNIDDLSLSLQKQDIATTNEEARKNYVNWLSKIEDVEPESLEITGIYPKDACIRRLEGTSVYGVVVDADNTVVALELIKGAKYPIFNERASKDIQEHDFDNETPEITPYQVTVDYKYDEEICPSLTLPSLRKQEEPVPVSEPQKEAPVPETEAEETPASETETEETPTETEEAPAPETEAEETPIETEEAPASETEAEEAPTETEKTPAPEAEEAPTETEEAPASETEAERPSLRERLRNTPLPSSDNIRERLQNNPLPEK